MLTPIHVLKTGFQLWRQQNNSIDTISNYLQYYLSTTISTTFELPVNLVVYGDG